MEDVYLLFFEDVLDMNEEISVASVKEYVDSIRENIRYFLEETNDRRRFQYQGHYQRCESRLSRAQLCRRDKKYQRRA